MYKKKYQDTASDPDRQTNNVYNGIDLTIQDIPKCGLGIIIDHEYEFTMTML